MLTEAEDQIETEIIHTFKVRGVSKQEMMAITTELELVGGYPEMLQWLKDNPNADRYGIMEKAVEICKNSDKS